MGESEILKKTIMKAIASGKGLNEAAKSAVCLGEEKEYYLKQIFAKQLSCEHYDGAKRTAVVMQEKNVWLEKVIRKELVNDRLVGARKTLSLFSDEKLKEKFQKRINELDS